MDRKIEGIKFKVSSSEKKVLFRIPMSLYTAIASGEYTSMKHYLSSTGNMYLSSDQEEDELCIPNGVARSFFKGTINGITSEIQTILKEHTDAPIQSIILVGGQAKSAFVNDSIQNTFPKQKIIIPEDPGLSVLKGAVLLGNKPHIIGGRIARYSYGISVAGPFIEGTDREEYKFIRDGQEKCRNVFNLIIKKGQVLKYGETFSTETHLDAKLEETKHATFTNRLYQSTAEIPTYVTDDGCTYLGKIQEEPPEGGWPDYSEAKVEIVVGEAEFKFYSKDVTNNRTYDTKVDFLFPKTGTDTELKTE